MKLSETSDERTEDKRNRKTDICVLRIPGEGEERERTGEKQYSVR